MTTMVTQDEPQRNILRLRPTKGHRMSYSRETRTASGMVQYPRDTDHHRNAQSNAWRQLTISKDRKTAVSWGTRGRGQRHQEDGFFTQELHAPSSSPRERYPVLFRHASGKR